MVLAPGIGHCSIEQRLAAPLGEGRDGSRAPLHGQDAEPAHASQVVAVMCLQVVMAWYVRDMPWWKVMLAAYVVSGTASQNLFTAQHELSHFLAFRTPLYNRILSLASNCPLVIPTATAFRKYHQEHHSHLVRMHALAPTGEALPLCCLPASGLVRLWPVLWSYEGMHPAVCLALDG